MHEDRENLLTCARYMPNLKRSPVPVNLLKDDTVERFNITFTVKTAKVRMKVSFCQKTKEFRLMLAHFSPDRATSLLLLKSLQCQITAVELQTRQAGRCCNREEFL